MVFDFTEQAYGKSKWWDGQNYNLRLMSTFWLISVITKEKNEKIGKSKQTNALEYRGYAA